MSELRKFFWYGLGYGLLLALGAVAVILIVIQRPHGASIALAEPPTPRPMRVDVKGAVVAPGVYAAPRGSIWQDVLALAGGLLPNADVSALNLAQSVKDGDLIIVPIRPPTPQPSATPDPNQPTPAPPTAAARTVPTLAIAGKVNLNTATLEELDALPGIGPAIAQRIIDYRTTNGPFKNIEAIQDVRGIGPALFANIKDLITVEP